MPVSPNHPEMDAHKILLAVACDEIVRKFCGQTYPLLGLLTSAVLKQKDTPVIDGPQRGKNLTPFDDAITVNRGTVVGLGLKLERIMKMHVPNTPAALGEDLAGTAFLDHWIYTVGITKMSDVHGHSESFGSDLVNESNIRPQTAPHVLNG